MVVGAVGAWRRIFMGFSRLKSTFHVAMLLNLSLAAPAFAQTPVPAGSAAGDEGLAEIVVTARRIEERLQDVPISITVFNQRQLETQNVVNAQDLATYTPSLSSNTNYGSENSTFAIRGFVQDIDTAPSVGTYFADVVTPRGASLGLSVGDGAGPGYFFDLQNVQVLKGPQGTLFGRNTTGGSVLLVPQKPTSVLEGYVQGSVGNFDLRGAQAVVNIPINEGLRVRFGVDHQSRKGYANNTSGIGPKDFDDVNYTALRAGVVADLTPDIENYTIASCSYSDTNGAVQKLIAGANDGRLGSSTLAQLAVQGNNFYDLRSDVPNPESKLTQWQLINTTTWNATDTLTLKNIVSYAQLKDVVQSALFGTNFSTPAIAALGLPSFRYDFANITPAPGVPTAHESTVTEEFRLQGRALGDRLTWQSGLYFDASRPIGESGSQSPVVISCANSAALQCTDILGYLAELGLNLPLNTVHAGAVNLTTGQTSYRDAAFYAQSTYAFNNLFKLTGGARYTSDDETTDNTQRTYIFNSPAPTATNPLPLPTIPVATCTNFTANSTGCRSHYSLDSHAPTWLIDFDYTPTQDILAYAKYARGYREGSISPNVTLPYTYVRPEKVDAYEVGMKTSFAEPVHGIFNIALFYNDFRNQQLLLGFNPAPGVPVSPTAAPINAGKSRIDGGEVEASVTPFRGFNLHAAYTYLDTKILAISSFPTPQGGLYVITGAQRVGDPLVLSPKNKYTVTGTYTLPIAENIGKVSLGATFVHTDSQLTTAYYTDRTSTFPSISSLGILAPTNLLNLNIVWDSIAGSPIDLMLFATNVTSQKYYTWIGGVGSSVDFETAQLGQPRMYGARIRVRFGSH